MRYSLFRLLTICCSILAIVVFAGSVMAQRNGGGNGGNGGGGGTSPSPVLYSIAVIPTPATASTVYPREIHGVGLAVGNYIDDGNSNAFLFDCFGVLQPPAAGQFIDFNQNQSLAGKLDAALIGWTYHAAWAVNGNGEIAGELRELATGVSRGFVLETYLSSDTNQWELTVLPIVGSIDSNATDINENGVVLGIYDRADGTRDQYLCSKPWSSSDIETLGLYVSQPGVLNNFGQVAGLLEDFDPAWINPAFFLDPNTGFMASYPLTRGQFHGLNDSGVISGCADIKLGRKTKGRPFRIDVFGAGTPSAINESNDDVSVSGKQGINSDNDVYFDGTVFPRGAMRTSGFISHSGTSSIAAKVWPLNDLIDPADPNYGGWISNDQSITGMSERTNVHFPMMTARLWTPSGVVGVVLIPHSPNN